MTTGQKDLNFKIPHHHKRLKSIFGKVELDLANLFAEPNFLAVLRATEN